jgi:hypothetical protein
MELRNESSLLSNHLVGCLALDLRLHRTLRRLIVTSFPRLRRLQLTISWGADEDLLLYSMKGDQHRIQVNNCLRPATSNVLEGGIAHELCHIDADLDMARYQRELAWERYMRSRWHRMHEERATERRVIELGFGRQLLAFVRFAHRLGFRFGREHGLLYSEIRRSVEF